MKDEQQFIHFFSAVILRLFCRDWKHILFLGEASINKQPAISQDSSWCAFTQRHTERERLGLEDLTTQVLRFWGHTWRKEMVKNKRWRSKCSCDILLPCAINQWETSAPSPLLKQTVSILAIQRAPAQTGWAFRSTRRPNGASISDLYNATVFPQAAACNWHFQHPEMTDERWRLAWKEYWGGDGKKSTVIER